MESSTNRGLGFILCCSAVGVALCGQAAFADQFCSNNGGASPLVCLEKSGPLFQGTHFTLDFSDPANVDITLLRGSQSWKLWSRVSQADPTPANLGDVTLKPSIDTDNFAITIENGTTGGPGAANVLSMVLKDTDLGATWVGSSGISAGTITGNLIGSLEVVQDAAGNGGTVQGLDIGGDLQGSLKATTLDGFDVGGDLSGSVAVSNGAGLWNVDGDISGTLDIEAWSTAIP